MEPVECGPVRWPVFGLLTALALPAALCQMCVIYVLVKKRTFYLSSASYQTALCLGLVNLVFMCTQWPVLVYSLGCGSAFPGLDQVLGGFYLAAFYACEPYGLILTLTRIRALFFGAAANAGGSPGGGASNMHVLERLGRFGFRALCLLLFPAMVGFAQFQLLSSPRCVFFYDKFSWELSAQCDRLPIMSAASRLMFALQAFNLLAYLFMAVWLKRKRDGAKRPALRLQLSTEQRILLSTMCSFLASAVLVAGQMLVSAYADGLLAGRVGYRAVVLLANGVCVFSFIVTNRSVRRDVGALFASAQQQTRAKAMFTVTNVHNNESTQQRKRKRMGSVLWPCSFFGCSNAKTSCVEVERKQ